MSFYDFHARNVQDSYIIRHAFSEYHLQKVRFQVVLSKCLESSHLYGDTWVNSYWLQFLSRALTRPILLDMLHWVSLVLMSRMYLPSALLQRILCANMLSVL